MTSTKALNDIRQVKGWKMSEIIKTREPRGLFWCFDEQAHVYIGCDNRYGDAWTEEFATQSDCIEWLNQ